MTEEITCPAEGCDYSGPVESVAGHAQAKRDPPHKGISYRNVMDEHGGNGGSAQSSPSTSSSGSTSGDNPTVDNGDSGGRDGQDMDPAGGDRYELPCGHETFAWSDVPDSAIKQENGTKYTYVSCDDCDGEWMVTDE